MFVIEVLLHYIETSRQTHPQLTLRGKFNLILIISCKWQICWETVLQGISQVSLHFMSRGSNCLCSGLSFQGCLYGKSLGRQTMNVPFWSEGQAGLMSSIVKTVRQCLPLEHRAGMLTTLYKMFGFPKLWVPLLYHNPLCVQAVTGPLHHSVGLGAWRTDKSAAPLSAAIVLSKLSFVSDSGVLFFTSRIQISTSS